jgi:hypothetical protein
MQTGSPRGRSIANKLRLRLTIVDEAASAVAGTITEIVAETVAETTCKYAKLFM